MQLKASQHEWIKKCCAETKNKFKVFFDEHSKSFAATMCTTFRVQRGKTTSKRKLKNWIQKGNYKKNTTKNKHYTWNILKYVMNEKSLENLRNMKKLE